MIACRPVLKEILKSTVFALFSDGEMIPGGNPALQEEVERVISVVRVSLNKYTNNDIFWKLTCVELKCMTMAKRRKGDK